MKANWNYPTNVWIGDNRIDDLNIACDQLNIKKPLFVSLITVKRSLAISPIF